MTAKLKVSEIFFFSIQGEGLYIGTPSVFLRLFGCNLTCSGFGMSRGQLSQERHQIDPSKYNKYEELPLVHTGCDSYPSWDPRFKKFSPMMTIDEVIDKIASVLPGNKFSINKHLIITGGEPLLPGWQKVIPELIDRINDRNLNLSHVTFETNGTQPLTHDMSQYLSDRYDIEWTFSISSKLTISGEKWEETIRPDVVSTYIPVADKIYFKWVVGSKEDIDDVKRAIAEYNMPSIPVYLMPVGGTDKVYNLTHKEVAEIAKENGWRYSPRLQVELYKNSWNT